MDFAELEALSEPWLPYLPDAARVGHTACKQSAAIAGVVQIDLPVPVFITTTARKLQRKKRKG